MANEFTDTNITGTAGLVGDIKMTERADHLATPAAGLGILWTKNTTPSTLMFTDDTGADITVGAGGAGVADGATLATGLTFPLAGLHILDTNASHDLIVSPGSDLTADRTLTITTGDADRTLTMTGAASIAGTNTGDQTITLTGDVTGAGTGTFAASIAAGAVDIAMLSATGTPSGSTYLRGDNTWTAPSGSGDVVGPAAATDNAVARYDTTTGKLIQDSAVTIADTSGNMAGVGTLNTHTIPGGTGTLALTSQITGTNSGTNTGDQTITLTGDVTGAGTGTFAASIDKTAITGKTLTTMVGADSLLFSDASNTGNLKEGAVSDLVLAVVSTDNCIARFDSTAGQIQNSVVTIADTSGNMAAVGTLNAHTIPGGTDTFSMLAATQTLTNKRITPRVGTTTSSATPTINTDSYDHYSLTAQTVDITSFTTNLTGTIAERQILTIDVIGTAASAITWGAKFVAGPAALPTTTVTTQRLSTLWWGDATANVWRCMASGSAA